MARRKATGVSRRSLLAGTPFVAAALLAPRPALAATRATGLRLGDHGGSTRFVLELSGPVTWQLVSLSAPYRLIIDMPEVEFALGLVPRDTGLVAGARYGVVRPGFSRMVIDLTGPAMVDKDFLLEPREGFGWRLVMDLVPTTPEIFMAGVGQPAKPVVPATVTPEPSTRAVAFAAAAAPAAAASGTTAPTPIGPGGPVNLRPAAVGKGPVTVNLASLPSAQAPIADPSIPGSFGGPGGAAAGEGMQVMAREGPAIVRLADGRRVPIPLEKPQRSVDPVRKPVIVLDPGHGGKDPGAIGASGTYEKIVTLEMARQLKRALEATGRYKVVLTRESDTSVRLRERIAFGRHAGADLFVSIHADAMANPQVRGLSVYTLSETASDDEAAQLADRENKVDILLGMDLSQESPDVATILIDLAQRETKNKSVHFANTLVSALPGDVLKLEKTRRYAGFAVLKAPDVPSVLVEMGFLSNVSDEKLLRTAPYRAKLAAALVRSVDDFFAPQQQRAWKP
ncbi:N-acetylmuramoyl-L-alanine amidase [Rhodospirillum rubrum F11]|nr:N-acetylmuramoyl-L-alanine amidase [Rhodospirillum rubrum F11]